MHVSHTSRVLIVEDDELRCHWFRGRLDGYELDITCDPTQAIRWLCELDYNLVLLDHDLLEAHYFSDAPDDERTGYAVAAWLAAHPDRQREATIIIHSLNYAGTQRMLDILHAAGRDAEHLPFPYLQDRLKS